MITWDGFLEQVKDWLAARDLLASEARWVIGVSGGPDSTLLLHALRELSNRGALNWALHVAHLHHGLRGAEADADSAFVASMADQLGLPSFLDRVNLAAEVERIGGSTEEVARQHRYAFLERVALKTGSEHVAVGHHADDNAETVLHRICRGTGLRGLGGMADIRAIQPGSRVRLVRPFLGQRRTTIEEICSQRQLQTRTDATNISDEFTRGRLRNTVLPLLRKTVNSNVSEALLRLAEQARWLGSYLEDAAARTFEAMIVSETPRCIVLNTRAFRGKSRIIQAEVIRRAISMVLGGEQELAFANIEAVLRLAADPASGKEVHVPGPAIVRKVYDRLEFRPLSDVEEPEELTPVSVNCPGSTPLPMLGMELSIELCDVDAGKIAELRKSNHPHEEWLDYDRLQLPMVVRGRRDGDRFWPLGAPGSKTLSDFLSDRKIDPPLRARTGVLCDQAGPIWVIPLRIDERVKLRPTSKRALRLRLVRHPSSIASGT